MGTVEVNGRAVWSGWMGGCGSVQARRGSVAGRVVVARTLVSAVEPSDADRGPKVPLEGPFRSTISGGTTSGGTTSGGTTSGGTTSGGTTSGGGSRDGRAGGHDYVQRLVEGRSVDSRVD